MSGEMEKLGYSHFKLPLVSPEVLGKVIAPYVQDISHEQWMSLADDDTGSEVAILLSNMCLAVIREISALVLEVVEPQVLALGHYRSSGDNVRAQGGCSCCRVTEERIQACFRNILHHSFGVALDIERSYNLDQLVRLFSAGITKRVNSSLAVITGSALSSDIYGLPTAECISEMVYNVVHLFQYVKGGKRLMDESSDELACPDCNCEQCCCFGIQDGKNVEQEGTELLGINNCLSESSACMDNLNPEPDPEFSECSAKHNFVSSPCSNSSSPGLSSPDYYLINQTFLTVLLGKLVDHIAAKTRTSILNVDLVQLVEGVTMRTRGILNFDPPQNVYSLHIPIYKKLCKNFESKYLLQRAMESGDEVFEIAVSETLISQLSKSLVKSKTSERIWNIFKVKRLSPVRKIQTPESHSEEMSENGSPVSEIQIPESHSEEMIEKGSPVSEIQTPESHWSADVSPVHEIQIPESHSEERSENGSPVSEIQTPESHSEERIEKVSPVRKSRRPKFHQSGKVAPVCELQTPESYNEDRSKQTNKPSSSNRSLGRTIRKKFSRMVSNVVDFFNRGLDSEIHRLDFTVTSPIWTNPIL